MKVSIGDRLLSAAAYLFGIPAMYIVLTKNRQRGYVGYHGAQAYLLWIIFVLIFFVTRIGIDLLWSLKYLPQLDYIERVAVIIMAIYALSRGWQSLLGKNLNIPH
ncbi:hypothetical protein A3H38_02880 [candidate division WOR-1 bacterium RIFCSPLOWO2_02_FULL_46_20]|uniref:Uncharacterized protein n=2 Tax=Saganbacteria TaxID=1703751 RepID=A0A1F4RAP3_UNCSA|nr:MAG: hypothetical protein A3J44_01760 [candidate division WOR-1 bacterium RIFCSPHIGHO2_02_FULL_45_12]OGC04593.1 MAG: hypothetical protein A3H38_02880 [candidate division WOR-1 bacterium RIFCSPLOWO2_02_FULL_46_20]OGC08842.1 MAG: hypothetical protein A3F86_00120 [candidate division WOR-1 bacterium RIFCSPLOWO2_12_FULL_45_9]